MKKQWPLDTALSFDPYYGEPDRDGDQGYEINADGTVLIRIKAKDAREVLIDQFGKIQKFTRIENGMWEITADLGNGFQYFFLRIDGADVLNPYLPIGYGCCRPMHFLDIPVRGENWDDIEGIPHGSVSRRYYYSAVTGKEEVCIVYTPPGYTEKKDYPVLYLQHGYGENETGWVYQGHAARIADRMLSEGRIREMIIVMGNGMAKRETKEREFRLFPEILINDLIPFIESVYPVKKDKWNRAMAGLSMGSYQTSIVTLKHPELFGCAGIFSGFLRFPDPSETEDHLALLDEPERFNESFRVFYRAMGTEDQFFESFRSDDEMLSGRNLNIIRRTFPGGHDWSVWRRCIHDFLPMLFA